MFMLFSFVWISANARKHKKIANLAAATFEPIVIQRLPLTRAVIIICRDDKMTAHRSDVSWVLVPINLGAAQWIRQILCVRYSQPETLKLRGVAFLRQDHCGLLRQAQFSLRDQPRSEY
jgi:hypothetical protein